MKVTVYKPQETHTLGRMQRDIERGKGVKFIEENRSVKIVAKNGQERTYREVQRIEIEI